MIENNGKRVLLVDDDQLHLLWSSEVLGRSGYDIMTTNSANQALEMLDNTQYDLLISDLVMPEMKGTEFVRIAVEKQAGIKAIIMTGHGDIDSFIDSIYNSGAVEYIVKPIEVDEFVAMVNKLTGANMDGNK